jgi:outer membrane protein insertion porin family
MALCTGVARCLLLIALVLQLAGATALALQLDQLDPARTYHVDKIVITGNHAFSGSELLSQMKTKERPIYLFWQKRPPFDSDVFAEDLKRLHLFYRSHGYFRATVAYTLKVNHGDLLTSDVKITEHRPSKVERIRIVVNHHDLPPSSPLYRQLKLKPGKIFADSAYQASEDVVRNFYRNEGYANVTTTRSAEANVSENAVRIWYFAQPGVKGVFGKTSIVGAQKVQPDIIRRELTYTPGQQFSQRMLDESTSRLLKLGLFSVVRLSPHLDPENPRVIPIRLTIRERPRHSIDIGGGYNTQSQFIANFAWHDMNWLGGGRQLTAYVRYSNIDSAARITLTQPYLFNTRAITGILSLGEDIQQVPTYTLFGSRFVPSIRYAFSDTTKAFIGYRLEYDKLTSVDYQVGLALGGIRTSGIVSGPEAGFTIDTTNDMFNPSRGYVLDIEGMQAGEIFGGDYDFYRYWAQIKHYHLLGWKTILATRLKMGTGDYFGNLQNYPLFYRFYAGGEGSVRGYRYWRLGPNTPDNTPLGGLTDIEGSLELRRPVWDKLSGAVFLDFGQLSTHAYDIPITDLDFSAGPALSYNTPVGPVRIDVGIPFQKPRDQSQWQVYFSIGQYF